MSFRVIQSGTSTMAVGPPQPRLRRFGIAVGGPADAISCAYANALVGRSADAETLEIAFSGPILRAESPMDFAVVGAPADVWLNERKLSSNSSNRIFAGQSLRIGKLHLGLRCYLAYREAKDSHNSISIAADWLSHIEANTLRVLPGPQRDWFPAEVFNGEYTISPSSNRMGLRLLGSPLHRPLRELASEAVAPGAIQIANDGQPILIGVDGQTIGGYPKIAHVIAADLPIIGQLGPGRTVLFRWVNEDEAAEAWQKSEAELRNRLLRIRLSVE